MSAQKLNAIADAVSGWFSDPNNHKPRVPPTDDSDASAAPAAPDQDAAAGPSNLQRAAASIRKATGAQ